MEVCIRYLIEWKVDKGLLPGMGGCYHSETGNQILLESISQGQIRSPKSRLNHYLRNPTSLKSFKICKWPPLTFKSGRNTLIRWSHSPTLKLIILYLVAGRNRWSNEQSRLTSWRRLRAPVQIISQSNTSQTWVFKDKAKQTFGN